MLLEEYDETVPAVINPFDVKEKIPNIPKVAIACFANNLFESIAQSAHAKKIGELSSPNSKRPIYELEYKNKKITLFLMGVGAPFASMDLEEMYAMGCEKFIVFGNCGVLEEIDDCSVILPVAALRDEGTSYHYMPPSPTIPLNEKYREEFKEILKEYGFPYKEGITWTTDAFYRETRKKVEQRKKEGAIVVEMEAAALQAVAKFRNLDFFTFFYAGDNLAKEKWEKRSLSNDIKLDEKSQIAYLALELALKMMEDNKIS